MRLSVPQLPAIGRLADVMMQSALGRHTPAGDPVRCESLTKLYGEHVGVEDVDLDVPAGSVTGFLGANGAGKTTVIRMLVGLLRPTSGRASLWGRPALDAATRSRLGYMPADPVFYPALTGAQNLDLFAALHGRGASERAASLDLLELSGASLDRRVADYSSGMRQKLALVQAVQHRPDLVILDEPANRLDPLAHRSFEHLVRQIAADGRTVLLSSHTLSEVEDVCDRVAMIRHGRLLDVKDVAELTELALHRVCAQYRRAPAHLPQGLIEPNLRDGRLIAHVPRRSVALLRELLESDDLIDVTIEAGSLEETFFALYEERPAEQATK